MRSSQDAGLSVCIAVTPFPPHFGGHGLQVARSLPHLAARGVAVSILTDRLPRRLRPAIADDGSVVHRVLTPGRSPWAKVRRIGEFRDHFRRHRYDVVHSVIHGYEFLLNIARLQEWGLPVLTEMVLLGSDDPLALSRERFGRFKLDRLRRVDAWAGISKAFLPRLLEAGIDASRFHVIYTGVDVARYRPLDAAARRAARRRLGLPEVGRIVLSAGSLMRRKGMDRVLETWRAMRPVAGIDCLLIAGPATREEGLAAGDETHRDGLVRAAEGPGLAGTVRFAGRVGDLETLMGLADLFLFLSRREGLGNVILEAMACGLPCVVSPLDGIAAEILEDGRTGCIVRDPDDARGVAALATRLLAGGPATEAMGRAARAAAVTRFSLATRAAAYRDLYAGLARGRPL